MNNYARVALAILAPLAITIVSVSSHYYFNLYSQFRNLEVFYVAAAIAAGVILFKQVIINTRKLQIVSWLVYLFLLTQIIFWGNLLTACSYGDCL